MFRSCRLALEEELYRNIVKIRELYSSFIGLLGHRSITVSLTNVVIFCSVVLEVL